MFAGERGDVGEDLGPVRDFVRNEPGALAAFEMDLDAPQNIVAVPEAMELLHDVIEL